MDDITVNRGQRTTLAQVSLGLPARGTLAVIGERGAGKSTLIGAVLGSVKLAKGQISWSGSPVHTCRPALVMQEPRAAFNPVLPLRRSVCEPLRTRRVDVPQDRLARLCDGLELPVDLLERRPSEVSIGQAQRVGILRALIAAPPLVLFDEPLSALDAVTQKHTAQLIADLQHEEGFAALIVTYDLGYAAAFSDDIAVLRAGRLVETTPTADFVQNPQSEYGHRLRDAAFALGALEQVA